MKVLEVIELSGPDGVQPAERPEPQGDGVLIDVRAVALGFPDLLRSRGEYQDHTHVPYVLGQEFSGVVQAASPESGFRAGDRVAGMSRGDGALAERIFADPSSLLHLPMTLGFEEGAGAVFNYQTAIVALEFRGRTQPGETVLVHGAAGGTGTAAVEVAKAAGARVIALVSSAEKETIARRAAADEVVVGVDAWKDQVLERTDGRGVDVVFDPVGGDRMTDTIRALAVGGRWIVVGFAGGSIPQVPANRILFKNIEVVGSFLGGWLRQGSWARERVRARLRELLDAGYVRPIVGSVFELMRGGDALRELDERRALGKVVIKFD